MTPDPSALARMASRSEEDGHDRAWFPSFALSRRNLDLMIKAADHAREAARSDEAAFVPATYPQS